MKSQQPSSLVSRPNLVYVFADQMRASAMGHAPLADPVITPHLDHFASQGLSLTQCRSNFPVCSPYRAMLMSGRYPQANSVVSNINNMPGRDFDLRDDQTCLTDVLSSSDYHVGYIGKWHLTRPVEPYLTNANESGPWIWNEWTPPHRRHGIDQWYGYNTYDRHLKPLYWDNDSPREGFHFVDQWSTEHETDKAIDFLKQRQQSDSDQPFALFVSYNPPHPPFDQVPQKYRDLYRDATPQELLVRENVRLNSGDSILDQAMNSVANYFAAVSGVDDQFGRLMQAISSLDLAENTLLVFTADHGEMMGSHQRMSKNTWHEESVHVPMIIRLPSQLRAGGQDDLLISTPDIPATLLGLLGLQKAIPEGWQGIDYASTLRDPTCSKRPQYQAYFDPNGKLTGVFDQQYTAVISHAEDNTAHLYNRHADPYQCHNLAASDPKRMEGYRQWILENQMST